ncbi:MAG: LuxR C-terminal-related transcriptional regulator [Candidatus Didemnitutus sp.]|nr:LuxR C-terminal-related transcriptional regulator [Candidatus Didemnitutus sp.]
MSARTPPDLIALLGQLYAPGLDPVSFRIRTAAILRDYVGCHIVSFAVLDPQSRKLDIDFDPFCPGLGAALEGFGRHMAKYPCFNFDPLVNNGRPFLRSDFLSDEEFWSSPVYREGFALAEISDHAAILLPPATPRIYFIGLELQHGATFHGTQRDRMSTLQPHLANARLITETLASLEHAVADPQAFVRAGLTPREADVLMWLAKGKTNAEIGMLLGLRLQTVKGYVVAIFNKLGVDNRHAAILRAHQLALERRTAPPATSRRASTQALP